MVGSTFAVRDLHPSPLCRLVPAHPNARGEPRPRAGLGRDKARYVTARFLIPPVEHRACGFHRTRLNTLVLVLMPYRPSSSFGIFAHAFMPRLEMHSPISWHNQLAHSRVATSCASTPKARGLRHGEYAPCVRLSRTPTPTPHPPLLSGIGISSGVSPFLLSTLLRIPESSFPCSAWKTQTECWRWRVAGCPVRALRLPRLPTGYVRLTCMAVAM